jgi:hypothetical protein
VKNQVEGNHARKRAYNKEEITPVPSNTPQDITQGKARDRAACRQTARPGGHARLVVGAGRRAPSFERRLGRQWGPGFRGPFGRRGHGRAALLAGRSAFTGFSRGFAVRLINVHRKLLVKPNRYELSTLF